MQKRPYYVITYTREGDGYEATVMYVGCNYKAACDRYKFLYEDVKRREYIDEGVNEDNIDGHYSAPQDHLDVGNAIWSSLSDNDCYWVSIELRAIYLNEFINNTREVCYKNYNPKAKY